MSRVNELGDLGDRMSQGLPYNQGGNAGGAYNTFSSPDVAQDPKKFGSIIDKPAKHITPYSPDNSWDYVKDVEQIKDKVTPDEVICGLKYEMHKMVLKDKTIAKQIVVQNLKKDPKYYSKLHMMGIEPDEKTEAIMEVLTTLKARKYARKNGDFYL